VINSLAFLGTANWLGSFLKCLTDNAQNATPGQLGAVGTTISAAAWGAFQNAFPKYDKTLTPATPVGPGIIDTAGYLKDIAAAGSPEAANRAAAKNI